MTREVLESLDLQVYQQLPLADGGRIVSLCPYSTPDFPMGKNWPDLHTANHNVFRLDANNQVVWQVRRVESPTRRSWEDLHRDAKERNPACEGYLDPFMHMGLDESGALEAEPVGRYRKGCKVCLQTGEWRYMCSVTYELDIETGIAQFVSNIGWPPNPEEFSKN